MKRTLSRTYDDHQTAFMWTAIGIAAILLATVINVLMRRRLGDPYDELTGGYNAYGPGRSSSPEDPGLMEELVEHNWQGF